MLQVNQIMKIEFPFQPAIFLIKYFKLHIPSKSPEFALIMLMILLQKILNAFLLERLRLFESLNKRMAK